MHWNNFQQLPFFPTYFICMNYIWICVISCVLQPGQPAIQLSCVAKTFKVICYVLTCYPNSFIPALDIFTIDFYQYIPLSVAFTTVEGHKVSRKLNLLVSFSRTALLIRVNFKLVLKPFKMNTLILLWNVSDVLKGNEVLFYRLCLKKLYSWHALEHL